MRRRLDTQAEDAFSIFNPECENSVFLRSAGIYLRTHTARRYDPEQRRQVDYSRVKLK